MSGPTDRESGEAGDDGDHPDNGNELGGLDRDIRNRQSVTQISSLAVSLEGFINRRHGTRADFGHIAWRVGAQPRLRHAFARPQQQREDEETTEEADGPEP